MAGRAAVKCVSMLVGILIGLGIFAAPQVVTPQLHPGILRQACTASLFIGSRTAAIQRRCHGVCRRNDRHA